MTLALRSLDRVNPASVIALFAGLWLILSPWAMAPGLSGGAAWNSALVGLAIAGVAALRAAAGPRWATLSWINVVLGGWMIASLWIYRYVGDGASAWNSAVVGAVVLVLACVAETAPEAWGTTDRDYHPSAGWDYPYLAHPEGPGQPATWYEVANYGQGGLGDPEP